MSFEDRLIDDGAVPVEIIRPPAKKRSMEGNDMLNTHYRTYTADLELRKTSDGRTIHGIAVPYGRAMRINDTLIEQFSTGAFGNQVRAPYRVPFVRDHLSLGGSLIGATKLLRDDAAGLYGEWRVSKTPLGDETLALFEDGALRDLSIGFREGRNRMLQGGITDRVTATLLEVAMVLEGAYGELATAQGVRSAVARPYVPPAKTPNLDRARELMKGLRPL